MEKLYEMISKAIEVEVEKEFDSLREKLFMDLERKKNQICAGIVLQTMKTVNIASVGDTITIVVREIKS